MKVMDAAFVQGFVRMADDAWHQGWHERNGGNLSYRVKPEEIEAIRTDLDYSGAFTDIGTLVPQLGGAYFLVTGSGKYFRNVALSPQENLAIIEINAAGDKYRIVWGLAGGGRPTSELPSHLMSHEVKKAATKDAHRVILHSHPANIIALTFVLPLSHAIFTRELWEMATECPVVFPEGVGVVPWMVPGGRAIAVETSKLMAQYNVAIWAHHGVFCSGTDFDETFGLMHTVEKAAEILVKVLSMGGKRQTITPKDFRQLAVDFHVALPEEFLK